MADKLDYLERASAYEIAYRLMLDVVNVEGRKIGFAGRQRGPEYADRKYLLDTYSECLEAAQGHRKTQQQGG